MYCLKYYQYWLICLGGDLTRRLNRQTDRVISIYLPKKNFSWCTISAPVKILEADGTVQDIIDFFFLETKLVRTL